MKRLAFAAVAGLVLASGAHAAFVLQGPTYSTTLAVDNSLAGFSNLALKGSFQTDFVLVNSDGSKAYSSAATLMLTGPGGLSYSTMVNDAGFVPLGAGFVQASHATLFDFLIPLSAAQQELFLGVGATNVSVALTGYSTTGPGASTAFYSWSVQDGTVTGSPPSAVPLPAALPMFLAGLGLIGALARRKAAAV